MGKKDSFSTNGAGKTGDLHVKINAGILQKNSFEMDQTPNLRSQKKKQNKQKQEEEPKKVNTRHISQKIEKSENK